MTVAAIPITGFSVTSASDHAIGEEAEVLRKLIASVADFSGSITVGEPKRMIRKALDAAYVAAQVHRPTVAPSTYAYANQFLRLLPSDIPAPEITAEEDGEIMLDWDYGPRCVFSVSVGRDGTLNYAALFGHNTTHGTEHVDETLPSAISNCLDRLVAAAGI